MGDYLSDPIFASVARRFPIFHVVGYGFASQLKSSSQFHPFVAEKVGSGFSSCLAAGHLKGSVPAGGEMTL